MRSLLYRIPFDGTQPSAIEVRGEPLGHLAFLESADRHLNVVVAQQHEAVDLLRISLAAFGDGSTEAPPWSYRRLADNVDGSATARFIGRHVIVAAEGGRNSGGDLRQLIVSRWQDASTFSLPLSHHVARIEPMGPDAVMVGTEGDDLRLSTVRLARVPTVAGQLSLENLAEAESRSHAFSYRPDTETAGMFGLPVSSTVRNAAGEEEEASRVTFVRNAGLSLTPVGALGAGHAAAEEDHCLVSCTDWYGNARPIFLNGRIFALLGYELVEGRMVQGAVVEERRLDFTPRPATAGGAGPSAVSK